MNVNIVLTGILKDGEEFLIVKRNENDNLYPGAWEFPGGHLEIGERLKDGLKRELQEEIGFDLDFVPFITHYSDELKNEDNRTTLNLEMDFVIEVDKSSFKVTLSNEHSDYKWVSKDSNLLDEYIKDKLSNL